MTGDATNRTSGASTVLAALVAGNLESARSFGLPAAELARQSGLDEADLRDPDGRVPLERHTRLLENIDAHPGSAGFGFWLGAKVSVRMLGVVGFVMQHAPDLRAAFRALDRFRTVLNDFVSPVIEEDAERVTFRRTEPPRLARLANILAAGPVGTLTLMRELTGLPPDRPLALEAAFQHPPPADAARYREVLGCPVHFNASEVRLVVPRAVFDRPLRHPDPGLYGYLEQHARALQERLSEARSLADQVRERVLAGLRDGEPQQAQVARLLALSERTLQRRLREEGTTFAALVDGVRADMARLYLADPRLAVFEVAYLLGYSDPRAFQRAFRRWTGATPRRFRQTPA